MSKFFSRRRITPRKAFLFAYDMVSAFLAALFSLWIAYDATIPARFWQTFKSTWFIYIIVAALVYYTVGFYDQMWAFARGMQYAILPVGTVAQVFVIVLVSQIIGKWFSFQFYIIYWFLVTALVALIRVMYRFYSTLSARKDRAQRMGRDPIRVMIVGAGAAGSQIITELKMTQKERVPICAVDDNPYTHHYKNNGVPVLGDRHDIPRLVRDYRIDEIIVAIPSASRETVRSILAICHETPCKVSTLPFFTQLQSGQPLLSDVREIKIEDLLGREPVELNLEQISDYLFGKVVLVTGAGGSIGSELARQIASYTPSVLILFDIYENNVYELQQELKAKYHNIFNLQTLIGSVRDVARLEQIFSKWKPTVIFHAAAHKHVPLMEESPCEAVKNNIFGTYNVARLAATYKAEKFVLISTDKAVNPTNVMGATKRLCEIVILALNKVYPATSFAAVRFGNVLGSNGSVIPLFEKQIREQHRVTVTHPDISRYFMTIPEASGLVLQASGFADGGEIFILDMGEPVKILTLARDLIRLSGFVPDVDIPIEFIGLRPGEKMTEELFLADEETNRTEHDKIMTLKQVDDRDILRREVQNLERIIRCPSIGLAEFMDCILNVVGDKASDSRSLSERLPRTPRDVTRGE